MVCPASWSRFSEVRGEPTCVCGRVWVERLESGITLLTDMSEAIADLVIVTRGALIRVPERLFMVESLLEAL